MSVQINENTFPDEGFRNFILDNVTNSSTVLTDDIINNTTDLDFRLDKCLTVKGIEYFVKLKTLRCQGFLLSGVDFSKNIELTSLDCAGSANLTSLDLSKNTKLTYLRCGDTKLTSLDLSKNIDLAYLDCSYSSLTSLDISKNTKLTYLDCGGNQLSSLDVSKNTLLTTLNCIRNQLTNLDVSQNPQLQTLYCGTNSLLSLDVSNNTELTYLDCGDNRLASLDVSKNTKLDVPHAPFQNLNRLNIEVSNDKNFKYQINIANLVGAENISKVNFTSLGSGDKYENGILKIKDSYTSFIYGYDIGYKFSITMDVHLSPDITIITAALPNAQKGAEYNQTLAAESESPVTWSIISGELPPGLTLNSETGVISGTIL